jgi:hypothetical protein
VVTRRCPMHGDIWRSVVVESADAGHRDVAAASTVRLVASENRAAKHEPGRGRAAVSFRRSRDLVVRVVDAPDRIWSGSSSVHGPTPSGCGMLGPASGLTPGGGPPTAGQPGPFYARELNRTALVTPEDRIESEELQRKGGERR